MRAFQTIAFTLFLCVSVRAAEPAIEKWGDDKLPVKAGLTVWLDASHQGAAWNAHGKGDLVTGDLVDTWYDASGNARDFVQAVRAAQPKFVGSAAGAAVRFDGEDDHLRTTSAAKNIDAFTLILVAAAHSNAGQLRGFFSAQEKGKNDYATGFNIDLGPGPSVFDSFDVLSVEGRGFIGVKDLLDQAAPFQKLHVIAITSAVGKDGVKSFFNGKLAGQRDRGEGTIGIESVIVGARCYSNEPDPPSVRGFLHGDVAEVMLFDRVLPDDQRAAVESYLMQKHAQTDEVLKKTSTAEAGEPLKRVEHAPAVQMFLPSFSAKALPLDLTNINNIRYRADGKLVAMAYDGNVYLLSDTNGDGLEDKAELFWDNKGRITSPIGICLTPPNYPKGDGLFIANKGKLSLVVDTDHDDKADKEIVVAQGWPAAFHQVDGVGVAIDKDGNVFFGIGTANFADPYLTDKEGKSHYDLKDQRGTIQKVSPDFSKRETVCTGTRFPVGMAFNPAGDLFITDQEGATWMPNGNPFDELLHIEPNRHYGFPPRHPMFLPDVIDEPSVFDYAPQHQSTCGLLFNEPVNGGPTFGPKDWRGDAIVCGSSRGKLYHTRLVKTASGYVAKNEIFGSLPVLTIDSCVSPNGELVLTTHSGAPDWGTGPTGKGKLYKISYEASSPQPLYAWPSGPREVRVALDRPIDPASLAGKANEVSITFGQYVGAGDRFEVMWPGYAAVKRQQNEPRQKLAVLSMQVTPDGRTLVLTTAEQTQAVNYAVTMPSSASAKPPAGAIEQVSAIDLAYDLGGVAAEWQSEQASQKLSIVLPHADLAVSRTFTAGSAEHDVVWKSLKTPGKLKLRTSIDMWNALRPAIQPGSQLDHTFPPEKVTLTFASNAPIEVHSTRSGASVTKPDVSGPTTITFTPTEHDPLPVEIVLSTGLTEPTLTVNYSTAEDPRPRAVPLRRFVLPWARVKPMTDEPIAAAEIPQLKGGDWLRGRDVFFSNEAACFKCHQVRRQGSDLGPDLSNLIHRDYESVMRDIREPSGALNPDYLGSIVKLKDGKTLAGIVRSAGEGKILVRGDALGERSPIAMTDVAKISPSPISIMPTGLVDALGEEHMRDLLTFLLTEPLAPSPLDRKNPPPARTRAEVEKILSVASTQPTSVKPLHVLLVAGPKDHGPGEHDYPLWQKRWTTLLGLAEGVTVETANEWPAAKQWAAADVAVFYSANPAWTDQKGPELDQFLAKGKGLVYLHYAVNGRDHVQQLADRIGLAWKGGSSRFRHGQIDLTFRNPAHPITRAFDKLTLDDESYWQGTGDPKSIHLLADDVEEGQPQPLIWTVEKPPGRVFVSILGHYTWTFDDPLFRILLLRGICWAGHEPADRLSGLATIGARMQN